jgi:hypothetical protein
MSRNQSTIRDIITVACKLPWWINIVLAITSYFVLDYFLTFQNQAITGNESIGQFGGKQIFIMYTRVARFIVPFIFTVSAVASFLIRLKRKLLYSSVVNTKTVKWGYFSGAILSFFTKRKGKILNSSSENDSEELIVSSAAPKCPLCSSVMVERIAKKGRWAGKKFWGCPNFPGCKGIIQK